MEVVSVANKRDDFLVSTKRIAASRVGYRCSFPECKTITVGPSNESNVGVSLIGDAAHICAAAPGGKRYDPNMTAEERRGIDNCIWLCKTHARLIDTDEVKYSVELLKKWKQDAETRAADMIADINCFDDYYRNNGDNLVLMGEIIEGLLLEGNYKQLNVLLSQYKNDLSDTYNEFVLRYRIICNVYCNRDEIKENISQYMSCLIDEGINKIIKVLISMHMVDELKLLKPYCKDDDLTKLSELIISGDFQEKVLKKTIDDPALIYQEENLECVYKAIAFMVYTKSIYPVRNENGDLFKLYEDEFFYKCVSYMHNLMQSIVLGLKPNIDKAYGFIYENMDKINQLDIFLQLFIVKDMLSLVTDNSEQFNNLYSRCSNELIEQSEIKTLYHISRIESGVQIDTADLVSYYQTTGDHHPLTTYLLKQNNEYILSFLDDHRFLFSKESEFIKIWYEAAGAEKTIEIIEKYRNCYSDDFSFNCIDALCGNAKVVEWLIANEVLIKYGIVPFYIEVLEKYNEYEALYQLSQKIKINEFLYKIGCVLANTENYKKYSKELFQSIHKKGHTPERLLHNLGFLQYSCGEIEKAKESFRAEYDTYKYNPALFAFLCLRYETNQYIDDQYLEHAKNIIDAKFQHLVGITLMHLNNEDAFTYLLRSLLIEETSESMNGICVVSHRIKTDLDIDVVGENTVCELVDEINKKTFKIAIHKSNVITYINPNTFGDCSHYSFDDPTISNLLFAHSGDVVDFLGDKYMVANVEYTVTYFCRYCFSRLMNDSNTLKINSDNPEEALKQIADIVKKSSDGVNRVVKAYNESPIQLPLSLLSKMVHKSMLRTYEFLCFENDSRIKNNTTTVYHSAETTYILSYDAILNIFTLELENVVLEKLNVKCALSVKEHLLSEINEEITEITNEGTAGYISIRDDRPALYEIQIRDRQVRHSVLTKLKAFVNKIPVQKTLDFEAVQFDFSTFVSEHQAYCENGSLALTQINDGGVLVTDIQFLYSIATLEGLSTTGIVPLLTVLDLNVPQLLKKCIQLSKMNFSHYFSKELYNSIVGLIYADEASKTENKKSLLSFLVSGGEEPKATTAHHRELIIQIYREICEIDTRFLVSGGQLSKIALHHYFSLYPKEKERIAKQMEQELKLLSTIDESNDAEV